uniref:Reverse transcriptase Ty1/copia-type domain-containing protein n=1 Tax=Tanacetum cinerariifolium TaxID=118510 RepID=A0A699H4B9_TANCI|nr:hypothetical protein [Tanacetum cinerariifolium]
MYYYISRGLREDYNGLKSTLLARQAPTAFHELQGLLADHDYMIKQSDLHNKIMCKLLLSLLHNLVSIYNHLPNMHKPSTLLSPKIVVGMVAPPTTVGVVVVKTIGPTKDNSIGHPIRIQFMKHATDVALVTFHYIALTVTLLPSKTGNNFRLIMLIIALNLPRGFLTLVPTAMYHQILLASTTLNHIIVRIFSMLAMAMKDKTSYTILLMGPSKHQLYSINLLSFQHVPRSVFTAVRALIHMWHQQPGHPHSQLLHSMLSKYSLLVLNKTLVAPCNAANKSPKRRAVMAQEYDVLMRNAAWSLVPPIPNANVVDCKWVYKFKRDQTWAITCYKARLVAKGFNQQQDLGTLSYFLGVKLVHRNSYVILSQKKYILELLQWANFSKAKLVPSSITTTTNLHLDDSPLFDDPVKYRQLVGALQSVTLSRPDITYAVKKVCQFMHSPTTNHWSAVKRILRYLRESEYKALADTVAELTWIEALLRELKVPMTRVPVLWCDNLGVTYLSANPVFHAHTKHVEVDFHFVREKVVTRKLYVQFITTHDQIADIFTKPLSSQRFAALWSKMRVVTRP